MRQLSCAHMKRDCSVSCAWMVQHVPHATALGLVPGAAGCPEFHQSSPLPSNCYPWERSKVFEVNCPRAQLITHYTMKTYGGVDVKLQHS
jgi:hypothetical protein